MLLHFRIDFPGVVLAALAALALAGDAVLAQPASGSHHSCRGGSLLGGGFDPTTGLYDWTCATENTDWHGSVDPSQASASYLVTCTGPGSPHPTCLGTEDRMIGAVHQVGMAAARTRPGGTVWVPNFAGKPYAIWVDDGCGTLADGETPAKCPPAYTPQWRHLAHFDESGPHVRGDRVQANRGVRIVAEGSPEAIEDGSGGWSLQGGWLAVDTGNVPPRKGPGPVPLDGEDADLPIDGFRFITGGARWGRYCVNQDDTSLACDPRGRSGAEERWSGEDVWISGAVGQIEEDYVASEGPEICLDNGITTNPLTTVGTCRGDRRYLCWDADGDGNTEEDRSDGSCRWTGTTPTVDLGPCDGFVDALEEDLSSDPDVRLAFRLSQCTQPAQSPLDCSAIHGHTSYITAIDSVPGAACGATGKTVELDVSSTSPVPIPDFVAGGSPNEVFVTRDDLYEQWGGGFHGFGFMPGNYFGQVHAGDVRFSGTTLSSGSTSVLAFSSPGWEPDQWAGLTAVIDPHGANDGPLYQAIAGNTSSVLQLTMATNDYDCSPEPCTQFQNAGVVTPGDVVEIRGSMCSGSFHGRGKGTSDETVCDQTMLTGNFAGQHAGFYDSLHFLCSTPNGGPSCADSNSLNMATGRYWDGRIWRARRGFISDLSGDHMKDYVFSESRGGTFLSNFSSFGVNEDISFIDNKYVQLIHAGGQNIRGAIFRDIYMEDNEGGGSAEILLHTVQDLTMEDVESVGGTRSTFLVIQPIRLGPGMETSDASNIVLRNLRAEGELGQKFTRSPSAAIIVDVNDFGNDTESLDGLVVENAEFEGYGPNQCGIWLEDDHSPGPVLPHMEESRPSMTFRNVFVSGASGESRAVCSGDSRGLPHDDATTSVPTFTESHVPVLENEWHLGGLATGGEIEFVVDSHAFYVETFPGQTAGQVAEAIAAAIAADPFLAGMGIDASAGGRTIVTNGTLSDLVVADAGLSSSVGAVPQVPALGSLGALLLAGLLALTTPRRRAPTDAS